VPLLGAGAGGGAVSGRGVAAARFPSLVLLMASRTRCWRRSSWPAPRSRVCTCSVTRHVRRARAPHRDL